jgi:hypothetical protein
MTPETIPDLNAFAAAAKTALDASAPTARQPEIAAPGARKIAEAAAAPAHEIAPTPVLDLPSAAELDRWLASPSRRAA